jgi:diguanylate cyclase (GGDEF)-like protein/PAS domain S-box-containing protein
MPMDEQPSRRPAPPVRATAEASSRLNQPWLAQQAVFDNAAVGIAFTDNRQFVRCNRRWTEMFGYAAEELNGRPAKMLYPSDDAYEALGIAASPKLAAGDCFQTEVEMRRKEGDLFWVRLWGRAVDPSRPTAGTVWIAEDCTAEREARGREREVRHQLEAIFETAPIGIAVIANRVLLQCNRRFEELFGYAPGEMLGYTTRLWYASDEDFAGINAMADDAFARGSTHRREQILRRKDGQPFWCRLTGRCFDQTQPQAGAVFLLEDVSERRHREENLRATLDEQQSIFHNAAVGILLVRNRVVQRCNRRFESLFGYAPGELHGRSTAVLFPSHADFEAVGRSAYEALEQGEIYADEWQVKRADGSLFWVRATGHASSDVEEAGGIGVIWIVDDVTDRHQMQEQLLAAQRDLESRVAERTAALAEANALLKTEVIDRMQAEERVWQIAHHDTLTGLPNRSLFQDRAQQALVQAGRSGQRVAVLFIDLDRFKQINDSLGHEVGDIFLKGVAARLAAAVRQSDTVARLGGDEFVVLAQQVNGAEDVRRIAGKILGNLREPIAAGGHELHASASIGVAIYPEDASDLAALLRAADTAMYAAKAAGRNDYRFFSGEMASETARLFDLEQALRRAVEIDALGIVYQPVIDIGRRRICAIEASLRWRDPERGEVGAETFLPIAEESGLIVPIGERLLLRAATQAMAWARQGFPQVPVVVDLSPRQFWQKSLVAKLRDLLAETGLPPARLELDINEDALMRDPDTSLEVLAALSRLGIRLTVADFGTGYSSLAALRRFPVDRLKIDKSFVRDLCDDSDDAAIVAAVIAMAQRLGLSVQADGVETAAQLLALRDAGCTVCQGPLLSLPRSGDEAKLLFTLPEIPDI